MKIQEHHEILIHGNAGVTVQFSAKLEPGDLEWLHDLMTREARHPAFVVSAIAARCRFYEAESEADAYREPSERATGSEGGR